MEPIRLICPRCSSILDWSGEKRLDCKVCGAWYPVERGIPIIRAKNNYYHELMTKEQLQRILARSQDVGWRSALAEQWSQESDQRRSVQFQILLDESRAAFKVLFPPLTDCRVLDLGCGSGSTAINVSRSAKEVVACDLTFERVAFLAVRAHDLGLTNLRVVCAGDTVPLPFPDSNFECVILNGVLEWSAGDGEQPVRDAQLQFLRQVRRVLKLDGHLYIGIENRFGYHYFLGAPEDHTGVRFASIAPRSLANILVRNVHGRPYRTYTYGYSGYRRLLREAGFTDVRFFTPLPDYRNFHELVSLNGDVSCGRNAERTTWRKRVKKYLEHRRRFTPSFGMVASGKRVATSWAQALVEHVRKSLGLESTPQFPTIRVSASSSAGLMMGIDDVFIRVALDPDRERRIKRNFEGLQAATTLMTTCQSLSIPSPLLAEEFYGVFFTVESIISGQPLSQLSSPLRTDTESRVLDLMLKLKTCNGNGTGSIDREHFWKVNVIEPFGGIIPYLPTSLERDTADAIRELASNDQSGIFPVTLSHGDFWAGNIVVNTTDHNIGFVDWDRWARADFGTHDFLHFLCYRRVLRDDCGWGQALIDWIAGTRIDSVEAECMDQFSTEFSLPSGWKTWAAFAYWVREITGHGSQKVQLDCKWSRQTISDLLPHMKRLLHSATR